MKSLFKLCLPLLATALLASCGGGGGDGHGGFTPPASGKIKIVAETQNLPLNSLGASPSPGGPFTTEVTITLRHRDGTLINAATTVNVSINPVGVATFSTLDDPSTTDINEVTLRLGQGPVDVVAGQATVFVTSYKTAGTASLSVTSPDVNGLSIQSASMDFTVGNVAAPTPANIDLSNEHSTLYVSGSGGRSSSLITATVTDAGNQTVPDSSAANVQFEVVGDPANGSLSGDSGSGQKIQVHTTKGVAHASFHAGTEQGPITVKVTADGDDNDVSNGISNPVTATTTIGVSDGKPFSISLVSPIANAVFINAVTEGVDAPTGGNGEVQIPADPDGTYSLTVSAVVTDRQGNPALPGTTVSFGAVDAPLAGFPSMGAGYFVLSGNNGDPQEGGTLFTALGGNFTHVPGGGPQDAAGPGDTLLVYGKYVPGNSDLESARQVATINNDSSLNIVSSSPFNLNDVTGHSVDDGPVLPYVIGRADNAVIGASATTDEHGTASVKLTYPIDRLGKHVAVFARADGRTPGDGGKIVSDIADYRFPGVAPAKIAASPSPIRGNGTVNETVCVTDALDAPMAGLPVFFGFHDLGVGTGSIDGTTGSGSLQHFTGTDGCVVGVVQTSGIAKDGGTPAVRFNAAGASVDVPIVAGGDLLLMASPSALSGYGGKVTLTLVDGGGNPVSGVQIGGTCEASGDGASVGITAGPGVTDSNGQTTATITANGLNGYNEANSGSCEFNTAGGDPKATVTLNGIDLCALGTSPVPTQCGTTGSKDTVFVSIIRASGATNTAAVSLSSNPAGIACSMGSADNGVTCSPAQFSAGDTVTLSASITNSQAATFSWTGDCTPPSPGASTATIQIPTNGSIIYGLSCTLSVGD